MTKVKKIQRWAICLRIAIFVLNAFVWLGALFAIICGLMVGFSNGTFSLDAEEDDDYVGGEIRWKDALYTTPATLLIYYGVLMLITAIFGCFAGAGARRCCNITYVVAIVVTLLFDMIFGYFFFWNPFAMRSFIKYLDKSMDSYGVSNSASFGIIPHHPTKYWDHLQKTGSCCGKFGTDEWKTKTIGSEKYSYSIPDSCCTKDYEYRKCGWRVWKHMEGDMDHYRSQMLKKVGCISIFPEEVTTKYEEVSWIVIILGLFMVACAICAIVLLFLIFTKKYKAGQGPQQLPRFARTSGHGESPVPNVPIDYSINDENDSRYHDVDFAQRNNQLRPCRDEDEDQSTAVRRQSRIPRLSIARAQTRIYPTYEDENQTGPKQGRRATIDSQDTKDTPRRSILRTGPEQNKLSTTEKIYFNRNFETNSEVEALPVVYRGRAENRVEAPGVRDRGMSR